MLSLLTNSAANTALRNLNENSEATKSSIARMSSGSRIAKPSDDAASLAISNRLSADISSLEQAGRNASQANSMLSVGNGAYDRIGDMLNRMKTLATQSINDTLTASERSFAQAEFNQLRTQITETAEQTRFNGLSLLTGGGGEGSTVDTVQAAGSANIDTGGILTSVGQSGYVHGVVSDVSVAANGASNLDVSVTVGDQTFSGVVAADEGTSFTLASTSNGGNTITVNVGSALNTGAGTDVENALANLREGFGLDDATPASFNIQSVDTDIDDTYGGLAGNDGVATSGTGSTFSVGSNTEAGVYSLSYSSNNDGTGTFELTNGTDVYTADVSHSGTSDGDVQTVSFSNGVSFTLESAASANGDDGAATPTNDDSGFNFNADLSGIRLDVSEGSNVSVTFQVGAQSSDQVGFEFTSATAEALGLSGQNVTTIENAEKASAAIDTAIQSVNTAQAELGATMSRFEQIQGTIGTTLENLQAAKSSFNDVDMAKEMSEFTKNQTLQQASIAMLSQANQMPQQVLRLIQ